MSNIAPSTASNALYLARCRASTHNESLCSRENAADLMGIDRGRLYRIEAGVNDPYPEEIVLMHGLYNDPKLPNWYCREKCPLGKDMPVVGDASLDRLTVRAIASLSNIKQVKKDLITITADGVISDDERPVLDDIIRNLDELNEINQNLKVWRERRDL